MQEISGLEIALAVVADISQMNGAGSFRALHSSPRSTLATWFGFLREPIRVPKPPDTARCRHEQLRDFVCLSMYSWASSSNVAASLAARRSGWIAALSHLGEKFFGPRPSHAQLSITVGPPGQYLSNGSQGTGPQGQYLGNLSANPYDPNSVSQRPLRAVRVAVQRGLDQQPVQPVGLPVQSQLGDEPVRDAGAARGGPTQPVMPPGW
jgi:hypothetical protein